MLVTNTAFHRCKETHAKVLSVLLEALNLVLNIVDKKVAEALLETLSELAKLVLKELLVEHLADGDAVAGSHGAVGWANTALRGADAVAAKLLLLQSIDLNVAVGDDVATIGHQEALADVLQALGLEIGHLLEEGGDVNDGTGSDEADALLVQETRGKKVCGW